MLGKLILAFIGYSYGGFLGAIGGLIVGMLLNAWLFKLRIAATKKRNEQFFRSTFVVMGYLAKVDGTVSKEEIAMAESVMAQFGFDQDQRRQGIDYFNQGKGLSEEEFHREVKDCRAKIGRQFALLKMFLEIQVSTVLADQLIDPKEERALQQLCQLLGVNPSILEQIFAWKASGAGPMGSVAPRAEQLKGAYALLEVDEDAEQAVVKRAYRKALSANHPDKLMAKGLPESMIKAANEKTHQIKQAWSLICQTKGWKA